MSCSGLNASSPAHISDLATCLTNVDADAHTCCDHRKIQTTLGASSGPPRAPLNSGVAWTPGPLSTIGFKSCRPTGDVRTDVCAIVGATLEQTHGGYADNTGFATRSLDQPAVARHLATKGKSRRSTTDPRTRARPSTAPPCSSAAATSS